MWYTHYINIEIGVAIDERNLKKREKRSAIDICTVRFAVFE
jgi:hypothetical protein